MNNNKKKNLRRSNILEIVAVLLALIFVAGDLFRVLYAVQHEVCRAVSYRVGMYG